MDRLLGAASYQGSPPLWLVSEGLVVAVVGTALVVGAGGLVVLGGLSPIRSTALIAVAVAAVVLYLLITRAGHALVAGIAILGAVLAPAVSRLAAELVLCGAGRTQDVVVTAVAYEPAVNPAYACTVRLQDGAPVQPRLRRGCGPSVVPGDLIAMVYDPAGRVAPRGLAGPGTLVRAAAEAVFLVLVFATVCFLAVVRSYRVPSTGSAQPRG
ncbi:hypothetical protein [Streptomyces vilmorinianum]|uniref:hypothetical protein n=1 Tax=Streptomyces vilmorinianum TaxID=3051092 RepID=UPI0010FB2DFA|nr:hypothetical protein [Streptomyces vilmorinianum]